jgi:hypothetical protein
MDWNAVLVEPVIAVLTRVADFLPKMVGVLIILIVGWIIAKIVQTAVIRVLKLAKLDVASEKSGIAAILSKGEIQYTLSEMIAVLVYWLLMLIVLMAAINAIGLTVAADLLNEVISYLPNVIAAVFILVLGIFFSGLMDSIVRTAASNAGVGQAKLLGQIVKIIVLVFTAAIVLEQLNIGTATITWTVNIILAAIGLAIAIAFGLGCKDLAGRAMQDMLERLKKQ